MVSCLRHCHGTLEAILEAYSARDAVVETATATNLWKQCFFPNGMNQGLPDLLKTFA